MDRKGGDGIEERAGEARIEDSSDLNIKVFSGKLKLGLRKIWLTGLYAPKFIFYTWSWPCFRCLSSDHVMHAVQRNHPNIAPS